MTFKNLGLQDHLLQAVAEQGYQSPTPIQQQAIPEILGGQDIMAGAQTGTGKTAGFALPILDLLSQKPIENKKPSAVRALILTPTRELAVQVHKSFTQYGQHSNQRMVMVCGGMSMNTQLKELDEGVDILVATPGRLLDHEHTGAVDLSQLEILVLDEADRMLDMGFITEIQRVLKKVPAKRQTLFFSATFADEVKKLAYGILNEPKLIEVSSSNSAAETVTQMVHPVDKHRKRELISYLIGSRNWQQVLVFTRTKQMADQLAKEMCLDGIKSTAIHGDKSQGARTRALEEFKEGKVRALVATDVAARGIDIDSLEYVINFELPYNAEDYIHRIGRTGRAGSSGRAVSLVCVDEEWLLEEIEAILDYRLPQEWLAGFEPDPTIRPSEHNRGGGRNGQKRRAKSRVSKNQSRGRRPRR
ncbi:DEAD/DEAH box helicase [Vibrio sp. Of7-15]|uniref:DEAD/DEAH box helicase n=1 Tax=Vibrio sp. Of7-15 TaxID=2724879 RepID=UPI001EF2528C|nr:DEAD/DEAH box helicase [Vibrio sp. Of7-15]MCG7496627.1 DEAD/DEAH box helicase [Vibrio sp. Of7-15]